MSRGTNIAMASLCVVFVLAGIVSAVLIATTFWSFQGEFSLPD